MTLPTNSSRRLPDYRKITRADHPSYGHQVPRMSEPVENANLVQNKEVRTLNRAGSGRDNPILAGLGVRIQIGLAAGETLKGLWLFQDHRSIGANLINQVAVSARFATYNFMAGSGQTVAGDAETGAVKNFVRYQTDAGTEEVEFWLKQYGPDVVSLDGENALDDDLEPVTFQATIEHAADDWLDIPIDFFVSWNDEFHVQHRRTDDDVEAGFAKAYGGSYVVSFFDTATDDEGVGVQVNPVTQALVKSRRVLQVQNTAGLKEITVRFRSKIDSSFMVDVPIKILVVAPDAEACEVPEVMPCTDLYLKLGTALPEGLPGEPSVPGVQVEEGVEGAILTQELLVVTVRGATVGASPVLRVQKKAWVASTPALAGARYADVGSPEDYLPLVQDSTLPNPGPPYGDPHRYTIAFSVAALASQNVALLNIMLVDGDHVSEPVPIAGPQARAIGFMPIGGTGGGPVCAPY